MLRSAVLSLLLLTPTSAFSRVINFEVQGFRPDLPEGGLPWTGFENQFGRGAYGPGVSITSAHPFWDTNFVRLDSNPDNQNPYIDGYFMHVGGFRILNWIDISFSSAKDLSFDFGSLTGFIHVQLWGPGDSLLIEGYAEGFDPVPFTMLGGVQFTTGLLDLSSFGEVSRVRIDSIWDAHNIIIDNIFYRPAPEPGILLLLVAGLAYSATRRTPR